MMDLAHEMKKFEVFCHVSTAYVNCNRPDGEVGEVIYNMNENVEEHVSRIMKMSREEVEQNRQNLIGNYPNTYTYTKSLSEMNLVNKKGNLNLVILRPSIVAGALE